MASLLDLHRSGAHLGARPSGPFLVQGPEVSRSPGAFWWSWWSMGSMNLDRWQKAFNIGLKWTWNYNYYNMNNPQLTPTDLEGFFSGLFIYVFLGIYGVSNVFQRFPAHGVDCPGYLDHKAAWARLTRTHEDVSSIFDCLQRRLFQCPRAGRWDWFIAFWWGWGHGSTSWFQIGHGPNRRIWWEGGITDHHADNNKRKALFSVPTHVVGDLNELRLKVQIDGKNKNRWQKIK